MGRGILTASNQSLFRHVDRAEVIQIDSGLRMVSKQCCFAVVLVKWCFKKKEGAGEGSKSVPRHVKQ
jgi:hypothetical protein